MQIILASAKIMNDRLKFIPNISLSSPLFQNEAQAFARDMAQYSTETIAEMLGCSPQIAVQNKLRYMNRHWERLTIHILSDNREWPGN